jgi:hypothetical protein
MSCEIEKDKFAIGNISSHKTLRSDSINNNRGRKKGKKERKRKRAGCQDE